MIQLWIGLAVGTIMLAMIALQVWRECGLRRQLAEYRELLSRAAGGRKFTRTPTPSGSSAASILPAQRLEWPVQFAG
jgi:hypothetical protein